MRICVVGNSHIGALKEAVDRKLAPALKLDFFGATATALKDLRIAEGRLFAGSDVLREKLKMLSRGATEYDLNLVDVVVVVGGQLHLTSAFNMFLKYRPFQFHDKRTELVSQGAFVAALLDLYARSTGVHLLKLASTVKKRLVMMPAPLLNEWALQELYYPYLADKDSVGQYIAWLTSVSMRAWEKISNQYGAELLLQRPDTIADCGLTKICFAEPRTFIEGRWVDKLDSVHANAHYGALALESLRDHLVKS